MNNIKKTIIKKFGVLIMAVAMFVSGVQAIPQKAEAATAISKVPITCYPIAAGNFRSYESINGRVSGWIYPSDKCTIRAVYSSGWVRVSYPTSRGTKTKYALSSNFFVNTSFSTSTVSSGVARTVYTKSDLKTKLGSTYASDQVVITGSKNGNQQVLYVISGGYKLGFIKGSISTGSNPQGYVDSVTSGAAGKLTVTGWAFDRDSLGTGLQIHVYVGGPAGSGAPGYAITANGYRPDVNRVYSGVGNYHGFQSTISVSKTGTQSIYIYAINVGGGNANPCIGSKTVSIQGSGSNSSGVQVGLNVPDFKQYDSAWKNVKIGTKTIGSIGCLTCALADKYSYHTGTSTNPAAMKNKLSYNNNDLIWSSVTRQGYTVSGLYQRSINNSIMSTVYARLKEGKPVIIGGKNSKGGQHWVIIKGYRGNSTTGFNSANFTINDPNSSSRTTLNQFLSVYPTVQRIIY